MYQKNFKKCNECRMSVCSNELDYVDLYIYIFLLKPQPVMPRMT